MRTWLICSSCKMRSSRGWPTPWGYELYKAEGAKGTRSTNPDANDLVMRGIPLIYEQARQPSKDKNNAARALFEQALAIDPNNVMAITFVAVTKFL
jgi:hypothetical protein